MANIFDDLYYSHYITIPRILIQTILTENTPTIISIFDMNKTILPSIPGICRSIPPLGFCFEVTCNNHNVILAIVLIPAFKLLIPTLRIGKVRNEDNCKLQYTWEVIYVTPSVDQSTIEDVVLL